MGRSAKFSDDDMLDAAMRLIEVGGLGAATVTAVAEATGAPSGSIYHRFASRDLLMARLWLRTVQQFQEGFLAALRVDDVDLAARTAMTHTVRWSRENPAGASVLLRYSREDLVARWPDQLGAELKDLNRPVLDALEAFVARRFGVVTAELVRGTRFALMVLPYAAVRSHIIRGSSPSLADEELVAVAGVAILHHLDAEVSR